MTRGTSTDSVDEVLPVSRLTLLGLQHVLLMYAGAITVPFIVGGALKLPKDQVALLISADLFCCGIVTLIQSVGFWHVGIRLPVMMGVAFAPVAAIIQIGSNPALGLRAVFGAVIGSGIFTFLAAPYMSRIVRWFPPLVIGTMLLLVGITLIMLVSIKQVVGGDPFISGPSGSVPNPNYGVPSHLAVSGIVLVSILLMTRFLRGFAANVAVLLGIAIGFLIVLASGDISFGGIADAGWFNIVLPFQFGLPVFDLAAIATLSVFMVAVMIESSGLFMALGEITGRRISQHDIRKGLRADGIGNIVGGIFSAFTYTSYAQNVGLVQVTGVHSRWVCASAGVILIILGCIPKLSFVAASIPAFVLGAAAMIMFGIMAGTGVKLLSQVDFATDRHNLYVVAIGLSFGLMPLVSDKLFARLPDTIGHFVHNGILLGTFTAVILNALFSGLNKSKQNPIDLYAPAMPGDISHADAAPSA